MAPPNRKLDSFASTNAPQLEKSEVSSLDQMQMAAKPRPFTVERFQQASPASVSIESVRQRDDVFMIRPYSIWEALQRYRKLVYEGEEYQINDRVRVVHHNESIEPITNHAYTTHDHPNGSELQHRIAHIIEIRGHSPAKVYLRVFWMYKPENIPGHGRQSYHGENELIATNDATIINASAITGRATVSHWHEEKNHAPPPGLFWRQTFDVHTGKLSPLSTLSEGSTPLNPSQPSLARPNTGASNKKPPASPTKGGGRKTQSRRYLAKENKAA